MRTDDHLLVLPDHRDNDLVPERQYPVHGFAQVFGKWNFPIGKTFIAQVESWIAFIIPGYSRWVFVGIAPPFLQPSFGSQGGIAPPFLQPSFGSQGACMVFALDAALSFISLKALPKLDFSSLWLMPPFNVMTDWFPALSKIVTVTVFFGTGISSANRFEDSGKAGDDAVSLPDFLMPQDAMQKVSTIAGFH